MTYMQELREQIPHGDTDFPVGFYRNRPSECRKDGLILKLHWHEHFEIIDMQYGSAVFHIDSRPYEVHEGDLLLVPAGALHAGYNAMNEQLEFVAIVFHASLLRSSNPDPIYEKFILPYLDGSEKFPIKLSTQDEGTATYLRLVREATAEFEQKKNAYQLVVKHDLQLLFTLLSRQFLSLKLAYRPERHADSFKLLIQYIEHHYAEAISIEQAARMVNLNPYHFCRVFKKLTSRTFVDYVNWYRMNEAERMLRQTDLDVTEIAERVGCCNANYFTRLYKKYKTTPPSWERRLQQDQPTQ